VFYTIQVCCSGLDVNATTVRKTYCFEMAHSDELEKAVNLDQFALCQSERAERCYFGHGHSRKVSKSKSKLKPNLAYRSFILALL